MLSSMLHVQGDIDNEKRVISAKDDPAAVHVIKANDGKEEPQISLPDCSTKVVEANDGIGRKSIMHYRSSDMILLVGEGDFSFAVCLANAFGCAPNLFATSLDSRDEVILNYSRGMENLKRLEKLGCTVLHEVNAFLMSQDPLLRLKLFDRIVFNFPHAGFPLGFRTEHDKVQIKHHRKVVRGFLSSAHDMLTTNGEVHVTHKTAYPFNRWKIEKLAKKVGLCLVEEVEFYRCDYPGYVNKRGDGFKVDQSFPVGRCSTFKFRKPILVNI